MFVFFFPQHLAVPVMFVLEKNQHVYSEKTTNSFD